MINYIIQSFTSLLPPGVGALVDIVMGCFFLFMIINIILSIIFVINQVKELFRIV